MLLHLVLTLLHGCAHDGLGCIAGDSGRSKAGLRGAEAKVLPLSAALHDASDLRRATRRPTDSGGQAAVRIWPWGRLHDPVQGLGPAGR